MFATRAEITNLKARVDSLTKSEADYKEKYEEAKSHREHVEVELSQHLIVKDQELAGKDAEITELMCCLCESQKELEAKKQKSDSLEIDLTTEKVKAETAEEAHKVSNAALNVAQENYAEVQSTVEPLITDLGWLQHYGVVNVSVFLFSLI
ncbi:hypothetical protein Hdeb2414_s0002g00066781 [Helianthus debilis subsp. tardiflorus]